MDVLSPAEIAEFADVFADPGAARRLLVAAGLGAGRHPSWQAPDAYAFWTDVSLLIAHGIRPGLREALFAEAARLFPGNRVFTGRAGGGPPRSRMQPAWELLPSLPPRHVARDADLAALRALLADPVAGQVVGVWAMGGAGKSTVATALVHDLAVRAMFPDGIVWAQVGPTPDLIGLLGHVLAAFGDLARIGDVTDGARRLRTLLAGARCLIVLDDVWDIAVVEAFQPPAGVRVLVTSRSRQTWYADAGGHELAMADEDVSRRVLAAHAGCGPEELPPVTGEIVQRCGGLVLALALVGSMVRLGIRWDSAAQRLRRTDLDKLAARFAGYPHPNLLAALDASVLALPAAEADRFRELAVFQHRGPVPLAAVILLWQRTAGLDPLDAEDLLNLLARRSLVRAQPATATVTLHDLLFDYIRATLDRPVAGLHRLLASALVERWGGLPDLPGLRDPYDDADRYGLAALVAHLLAAGDPDTIDAVLAAERRGPAGRAESTWYGAHEDLGRTGDYLVAVRAAWADARTRQAGGDPAALARQATYALILGSVTSLADNIPATLLVRLVETGLWAPIRALAYAQATSEPHGRAAALTALADHLPVDLRHLAHAQAFTAATSIDRPDARVRALIVLASQFPDTWREDAVTAALAAATDIESSADRARAFVALAPLLPAEGRARVLTQALEAAAAVGALSDQAAILATLAPMLPPDLLGQALDAATAITYSPARAEAWAGLVPYLPAGQRQQLIAQALDALIAEGSLVTGAAWLRLAPLLADDQLGKALVTATALLRGSGRTDVLIVLTARLSPDERRSVLARALTTADALVQPDHRAEALAGLAPHLPTNQRRPVLTDALAAAAAIGYKPTRAAVLAALAPLLPTDLLDRALVVARTVDPTDVAKILAALAPRVPADRRRPVLAEALEAAITLHYLGDRADAVARLAPQLPADLLGQALTAATTIREPHLSGQLVARLAPCLPADLLGQALLAATTIDQPEDTARALTRLATELPADERAPVLAEALTAAAAVERPDYQARALTALAPLLPAGQRRTALAQALTAASACQSEDQASTLRALAPHLPADLLETAWTLATDIWERQDQVRAMAGLAPYLPAARRARIVAGTLNAVRALMPFSQAEALTSLAPSLPTARRRSLLARALKALAAFPSWLAARSLDNPITATDWSTERADMIERLAPQLPAGLIEEALRVATAIKDPLARARAVAVLAARLPADRRVSVLTEQLEAVAAVRWPASRARALATLAPHLPALQLQPALTETLEAAAREEADEQSRALAVLAPYLPADQRGTAVAQALELAAQSGRSTVVLVLPAVLGTDRAETRTAVVSALLRARRWWP
ncbi:hypothetical protein I6A84_22110 [Frankia sp. CNm7]|uniref:NB-ARC domain-containing protein n=1 Tax=Frankia nepalensis TaxID=1836974 RepID=A0A937UR32_9ACTN|nr:NB-ARC domain-containing protein [Frankia nepalensis]MBL7498990.1 hypothetical protein [Frankia nepalensis]MBL7511490.1 hypothetical protein [Frankia nepalensis]MBL7520706.1 hypothetical protein [Frankia nepalensis]MBL7630733.1 hypothetical protein [Frankia nepalensis]